MNSLRGRRLKGKEKGIRARGRAQGRREDRNSFLLPPFSRALHASRAPQIPFPFLFERLSSVIYYWTDPRQHGIYLFCTMIRKVWRPTNTPASYRLTVRGFVLVYAFLKSQALFYVTASFLLYVKLQKVSSKRFSTLSPAQNRIMAKHLSEPLIARTHDGNCWEHFRSLDTLKSSRTLFVSVSPFSFFVNSSC